jgi:Fibrinogen beta and gamma chains, C-terminal globular domain
VVDDSVIIGGQSVPVQSISGWIIWMRRAVTMTYEWNLPWASYKNGFGSVGDNTYWLGLERVYQLTSSSQYRLRMEMKENSTGKWFSAEYSTFTIGDETSTKYQINVNG